MRLGRFVPTFAAVCALLAPVAAAADPNRSVPAKLVGNSRFDPNQNAYIGPGVLTIDGRTYDVLGASTLLGILSVAQNGVMTAAVSHHFTSLDPNVDIDFYTFDDVELTPTQTPGLYLVVNEMEISIGRGLVRSGRFRLEGDLNLFTGETHSRNGVGTVERGGRRGSCELAQLTAAGTLGRRGRHASLDGTMAIDGQLRPVRIELRQLQQVASLPGGALAFAGESHLYTTDCGPSVELRADVELTEVPAGPGVYALFGRLLRTAGAHTIGEVVIGQGSVLDTNNNTIQLAGSLGRICGR